MRWIAKRRPARGLHVAVIMDGNGRWAEARGLPRLEGHKAGAVAVRRVVEAAPGLNIGALSLFAFSSDNWLRPRGEVSALLDVLRDYLETETPRCCDNGVRVSVIGSRERLSASLRRSIERAERLTASEKTLHLRIALNYSSRDAILAAVQTLRGARRLSRPVFSATLAGNANHGVCAGADIDFLIRTGGEKRLSDFLLWECAYAELYFTETMWPDFDAGALATALRDFGSRQRRFGTIPARKALRPLSPSAVATPTNGTRDYWLH